MRAFLDTSALAKRYLNEPGSDALAEVLEGADAIAVSSFTPVEMASLLQRLLREKKLDPDQNEIIAEAFLLDLQSMEICPVIDPVVVAATRVIESVPTKTLDAIQIGCAIISQPDTFVSADLKQIKAARYMGLHVVRV